MKNDLYRLERISDIGAQLMTVVQKHGLTRETLRTDIEYQWLVATPLLAIGEQTNCLSDELVCNYPDIPWSEVAGLRHRLVHDYENTDWNMIAAILFEDLYEFLGQVDEVLASMKQ